MIAIHAEMKAIESGRVCAEDSALRHATSHV